ncbi:MAG: COG1470 family protein [Candidatus Helarchaeota archaeon]
MTFNLTNAKNVIFTGTWTLYQKIGNQTEQPIFTDNINMGIDSQEINRVINLTGISIENNTRIEYYVKINSPSLSQESKHIAAYANVNKTKIFISNLRIEWKEKWESGTLNYNELFTIKAEVFNPSSENVTDLINITTKLGSYPSYSHFIDMFHFKPGITEIKVENQVINYGRWPWFHFTGAILTNTDLNFIVHAYLKESDPKGLKVNPNMKISEGKIGHVNLLLASNLIREDVLRQLNDPVPDWARLIIGLGLTIAGIIVTIYGPKVIGIALGVAGILAAWEAAQGLLNEATLKALLAILDGLFVILNQMGQDPPDFNYNEVVPIEIENLTLPELPPEFSHLIEYINLMNNYSAYIKGISITIDRYIGACIDENLTGKQLQSNALRNYTRIANTILNRAIEIQGEALGTSYSWNELNSVLAHNNVSYDQFLTNLTEFEKLVKNETVQQAIFDNLTQQGFNETQIEEIINHTSNIRCITEYLINMEANTTANILNTTQKFENTIINNIMKTNLEVDEIVELSESINVSSYVESSQNLEASVRADIIMEPSSIRVTPGDTGQLKLKISNLLGTTEPFSINIIDLPLDWEIDYQSQLNISGLTIEEIPINIFLPRNPTESPRVVPLRIIISNTVVDFNSTILISVKPFHELEISVTPKTQDIEPEKSAIYTINVKNLANVNDTFIIFLEGQIPNSIIELENNRVTLQPNQMDSIQLNISILENWASMENINYNFTLTAISSDQVTRNSSDFNLTVMTTPKSMLLFIISEISELQDEINKNLNGEIKNPISCQLDGAMIRLNESIGEYENGSYMKAVILDKLAKINLIISEILIWIGDFICQIEDGFSKYLISELHVIRDHITLTMGKIIDTTLSLEMAQIEIEILEIADNIYDYTSVSLIDAILININLWQSADLLDLGLINLAGGNIGKTSDSIQKAIWNLKQPKYMVSILNWIGSISDEDTQAIKNSIENQIYNLNILLN